MNVSLKDSSGASLADHAVVADLTRFRFFSRSVTPRVRELIAGCRILDFEPGEVVLEKDVPNDRLFIILSGQVGIHHRPQDCAMVLLREGDLLGEMSVFSEQATTAQARASSRTTVVEIPRAVLWEILGEDVAFAHHLLHSFASRLIHASNAVYYTHQMQERYKKEAHTDLLTSLYNRRWLAQTLSFEIQRCAQRDLPLSLLTISIDQFRRYNEIHGPSAGDQVLKDVANAVKVSLRSLDTAARYEAAELIAVLPGADVQEAERVAGRIHRSVARISISDCRHRQLPGVTISIGIGQMTRGDDVASLIARAEAALQGARDRHGDGIAS